MKLSTRIQLLFAAAVVVMQAAFLISAPASSSPLRSYWPYKRGDWLYQLGTVHSFWKRPYWVLLDPETGAGEWRIDQGEKTYPSTLYTVVTSVTASGTDCVSVNLRQVDCDKGKCSEEFLSLQVGPGDVSFVPGDSWLKCPVTPGASWAHKTTMDTGGMLADAVTTIASNTDVISTPCGTFHNCVRADTVETADQDGEHYQATSSQRYAPDVGLVTDESHRKWRKERTEPGVPCDEEWGSDWSSVLGGYHVQTSSPVVLVRGLQFAGADTAEHYWSAANTYLVANDYDVWVCDTVTGKQHVTAETIGLRQFISAKMKEYDDCGVPRPPSISIVAHSYGGLIARKYLHDYPNDPKVDRVIMLSTPNCGSYLADIGALAGIVTGAYPAISCLTTGFVQNTFNKLCRNDRGVPYHLFSGDATCGLNPLLWAPHKFLYWLPPGLGDDNDGVVTVDSAHGWRSRWTSSGIVSDCQVPGANYFTGCDHFSIIKSPSVLNAVRSVLDGKGSSDAMSCDQANDATPTTPWVLTDAVNGSISQDQTTHATAVVDDCPQTAFALDYSAGNVAFTLTGPSGTMIGPTSTDLSVHYAKTTDETGIHESYLLDNPALGTWTANLTGATIDPSGAPWSLMVSEQSSLVAAAATEYFQSPGNAVVGAIVMDDTTPITGAAVSADVQRPDQTVDHLLLYDDGAHGDGAAGDGAYASAYSQSSAAGIYSVRCSVTGSNLQGHAFSRIEGDTFQIAPQTATLSGIYSDHGEDTGPPPGFENVIVDVGVQVASEGKYSVSANLSDANGNALVATSTSAVSSAIGSATLSLKFDADVLRRSGVDGPYNLMDVELWDESGDMPLRTDHADSPYTTGVYECSQFSDRSAPDAVTDLAISGVDPTSGSVTLRWTAPSEDGLAAASYHVRYSPTGLSSQTWDLATAVAGPPAPAAPGTTQTVTLSALTLGQSYSFGLKSLDQTGNESELSNVPGVFLASPLDVRHSEAGTYGSITGIVTATSNEVGATYVEAENRSWGVRGDGADAAEAHKVYLTGLLGIDNGEPTMIEPIICDLGPATPIKPLGMGNRTLQIGKGLDFCSLLVRCWGTVTQKGADYLYLNDGSNLKDGTSTDLENNVGVRVICDPTAYNTDDLLIVTGISSCFTTPSGSIARRILVRTPEDVK